MYIIILYYLYLLSFQKLMNSSHIFSVIIDELKVSDTTSYRKSLMSFVNVLIGSHYRLEERCRIRDTFIGWFLVFYNNHWELYFKRKR